MATFSALFIPFRNLPRRNIEGQLTLELRMDRNFSADVGMGRGEPSSNQKLSLGLDLAGQKRVAGLFRVTAEGAGSLI